MDVEQKFSVKKDITTPSPKKNGGKRKHPASDRSPTSITPQKRKKPNNEADGPQTKNTVAVLNELRRNLVYKLESQSGPVHAPVFTMSVVVDGQTYIGRGRSKKIARIEAAAAALRNFIQFKDGATLTPLKPLHNVDFTSDEPISSLPLGENGIFASNPLLDTLNSNNVPTTINNNNSTSNNNSSNPPPTKSSVSKNSRAKIEPVSAADCAKTTNGNHQQTGSGGGEKISQQPLPKSATTNGNSNNNHDVHNNTFTNNIIANSQNQNNSNTTSTTTTTTTTANIKRDVVHKIQQSLDLFKNTNEKKLSWAKRLEKISRQAASNGRNGERKTNGSTTSVPPEKGPVMLLHELFSDVHFECVSSDGLQHSKFKIAVTVNDENRFEGTGPSKKMAKNAAAKAALAHLCNISFSPLQQLKLNGNNASTNSLTASPSCVSDANFDVKGVELPQTFADCVGKNVIEKFNEVMKGNDVYARRKVLAGFVMSTTYDPKTLKVISIATGTKCVSGEHMSVTGSVINDSHAEIIARRGLMEFFYSQLELHCNGKGDDSIFFKTKDSPFYKLKDSIYFHLYINTAPCGDARVFSPHENDNMEIDKHPNRKARGQLRTKVESGEGTIPVKSSEGIQTWDGVLQGQRLLTMSCSDKISRWNVLGVQGSLLAAIMEPVYLHSIVLGSLLHPAHMYRAICGRVESSIQGLPPPYRLNKPKLALMTSAESRNQTKPPNFSINWIIDGNEVEIVNSFTGKLINNNTNTNKMSRLSKQSFYIRYDNIIKKLPQAKCREIRSSYGETKASVVDYQHAKRELFAAFAKEDLGQWLKKPIEQDDFTVKTEKYTESESRTKD